MKRPCVCCKFGYFITHTDDALCVCVSHAVSSRQKFKFEIEGYFI